MDPKSGIRRLYWWGDGYKTKLVPILESNIENLKTGKIPAEYTAEALREIEVLISCLPEDEVVEVVEKKQKNPTAVALRRELAKLKGSTKKAKPKPASKKPASPNQRKTA
jgi:hypothetical protein